MAFAPPSTGVQNIAIIDLNIAATIIIVNVRREGLGIGR
jgi:hypothetical protein